MGLGFLGRGNNTYQAVRVGLVHVLGAALGGAIIGGALGWLGTLVGAAAWPWRPAIIAVVAAYALWHAMGRGRPKLGLQRQVPRQWARVLSPDLCYFVWGVLLGSGVATLIPYSAFLVVLATQFTAGTTLGIVSGVAYGAVRGAVPLIPLFVARFRSDPGQVSCLLPELAWRARVSNVIWVVAAGALLPMFAVWH